VDYTAEHTFQPSLRDIARRFRIASTKSVADLLAALERKGYVARAHARSRGLTLLGFAGAPGAATVPVFTVRPHGAAPHLETWLTLDRRLVPTPDSFVVRVAPPGAPAHGIDAHDLVLVHPSARVHEGRASVIRVDGDVHVRRLRRQGAVLVLEAPGVGADLTVGPGDDFAVLGALAGVIRRVETDRPEDRETGT